MLAPASWVYGSVVGRRNRRFDKPNACERADVPVVSIGNLTTGGTGKTPMVLEFVKRLRALGKRPAILTRGYGAKAGETADEVREFQETFPDVPVVVNADRVAGAKTAVGEHGADCCVMDDGFQHRRLHRDLDVVLVDALNPWGGGRLLPAGRLREPITSLGRADLCIVTRFNQLDHNNAMTVFRDVQRRARHVPVLHADIDATNLRTREAVDQPVESLRQKAVLAVCGLGNPKTLSRSLAALGANVNSLAFPDHRRYTARDVDRIATAAQKIRADAVVTTRKDWVKLAPLLNGATHPFDWLRLDIGVRIHDPDALVDGKLRKLFASSSDRREAVAEQTRHS